MYLDNKCYTLREEKNPYFETAESTTYPRKCRKKVQLPFLTVMMLSFSKQLPFSLFETTSRSAALDFSILQCVSLLCVPFFYMHHRKIIVRLNLIYTTSLYFLSNADH